MNWACINKKWSFIYTDYNGYVWLSTNKPEVEEGFAQHYWHHTGKGVYLTQIPDDVIAGYTPDKLNWKMSLRWRKE